MIYSWCLPCYRNLLYTELIQEDKGKSQVRGLLSKSNQELLSQPTMQYRHCTHIHSIVHPGQAHKGTARTPTVFSNSLIKKYTLESSVSIWFIVSRQQSMVLSWSGYWRTSVPHPSASTVWGHGSAVCTVHSSSTQLILYCQLLF